MSKYDDELMLEKWGDTRDLYLQQLIGILDDPDYDKVPILIDDDNMWTPEAIDLVLLVKHLTYVIEKVKSMIFNDNDK